MTDAKPYSDAYETVTRLMEQSARIGFDALRSLADSGSYFNRMMPSMLARSDRACSGEIPAPCWMPQELGEVTSHVCPGGTATLRFRITNSTTTVSTVHLQAAGANATEVILTPSSLILGAMERDIAVVSFATPAKAAEGQEWETLIWVRGCRDHYLRWTIETNCRARDACHEVNVEDGPDLIHHWYDHFYCDRGCLHRQRKT